MACPHCLSTPYPRESTEPRYAIGRSTMRTAIDVSTNEPAHHSINDLQFPNDIVLLAVF